MSDRGALLVVGGDSLVGAAVTAACERRNRPAFVTTRRRATVGRRRLFLDLESDLPFRPPADVGAALIVAAATDLGRCATDPRAQAINLARIPRLAAALLDQGLFVVFVSTNSVFGGDLPRPAEDDPVAPGALHYARQKAAGEATIRDAAAARGAADRFAVVRLTKVLGAETPPLPAWRATWARGGPVEPFADFVFAPVSLRHAGDALATVAEGRTAGNLHVSGAANVTYVDLARALAGRLCIGADRIRPTTAAMKGAHIPFMPRYSGLAMDRTTRLTGIEPQPLAAVADDLVTEFAVEPAEASG